LPSITQLGLELTFCIARPAFDCRGTLSIAFSKSSRAIVVKYEHTPLHKTVSDLVDRLLPTLPPPPVANGNVAISNKSSKAKRPPPGEGEEGSRKKRKRGDKSVDTGEDAAPSENGSQPQPAAVEPVPAGVHATSILNIPPVEAARRRELAINLLTGKNIDPSTLSPEQFNIFANQAPHLQELSLEMLAKYGAERLRIVHPDEKDQPASSTATPEQKNTPENGDDGAISASTPATIDTPSKKRSHKKPRPLATNSPVEAVVESLVPHSTSMPTTDPARNFSRSRKTRGTCDTCKQNQRICTKEHPECSTCIDAGATCVYLPPKPRRKSEKLANAVVTEDSNTYSPADQQHQTDYAQPTQITQPMEPVQSMQPMEPQSQAAQIGQTDPDNDEFIPDPNILSGPIEQPSDSQRSAADYFQSHGSELAFPAPNNSRPAPQTFTQSQMPRVTPQPSPALNYSSTVQSEQTAQQSWESVYPTQASTAQPNQPSRQSTSRNSNRRSVPAVEGPQLQRARNNPAAQVQPASSWNNVLHSPVLSSQTGTNSPTVSQQQMSKRSRSRKSAGDSSPQVISETQIATTLPQAAMQQQNQRAQAAQSPYLSAAHRPSSRAKSRQEHRSQTQTPVAKSAVPVPQIPTSHKHTTSNVSYNAPKATSTPSTAPAYDSYVRYNATSNDQPSSRIPYEPNSYGAHAPTAGLNSFTAAPSYEYPRSTDRDNVVNQALGDTSAFNSTGSSNANQWSCSQNRTPQSNTAPSRTTAPHNASTNTHTPSSRPVGTRPSQHQDTPQNPTYNQSQQPHSYGSYSSQQPSTSQQQTQGWYNFNSASANTNSASYSSNGNNPTPENTGYNQSQRSNVSSYPGYTGGDELYDLLRANGSGH
jgi:hypothetical protein